jgi:hypothetical protein
MSDSGSTPMREQQSDTESAEPPSLAGFPFLFDSAR